MRYLFIILIILVYLLGNFYVFYRIWNIMPINNVSRIIFIAIALIAVLSFFIFFMLGENLPVPVSSFFYIVGTSWLIIFLYFLIFTLFGDLVRATGLVPANMINQYAKDNWLVFTFVVGFIFLLMLSGYLKYRYKVRVDLPISIEKTIGKDSTTLKIVAISDLHIGYGIGAKELNSWIELINKENPDIVLIAGDLIDNNVRPLRYDSIDKIIPKINSKYGTYMVLGNHEYLSGISESIKFIEDAGIKLLKDKSVCIDSAFYLVGRDDKTNENRKSLEELVSPLDKTKPIILLDHQPYNLNEAMQNGIDLQLSGHTHRGQVWPISMITDWIYEDSYGYLKKGNTNFYVSSGIGIWGGKFRIGTQSEYVVIEMKSE